MTNTDSFTHHHQRFIKKIIKLQQMQNIMSINILQLQENYCVQTKINFQNIKIKMLSLSTIKNPYHALLQCACYIHTLYSLYMYIYIFSYIYTYIVVEL